MRSYILQPGDTPATVAMRLGVSKQAIYDANPHMRVVKDRWGQREVYHADWQIGQRIMLPVGGIKAADRITIPHAAIGWDTHHPNWPGSYISFWSKKIHETLGSLPKAGSAYDVAPLAARVASDPDIEVKLITWLRSNWPGPVQFVSNSFWYELPEPVPYEGEPVSDPEINLFATNQQTARNDDPATVAGGAWGNSAVGMVARTAAKHYLHSLCMGAAGRPYNPVTGECALS